ncbi:hypothetical protein MMC25_004622 [Agyrium rufum]|nr:hypothetical protein [Agyrium rufum]
MDDALAKRLAALRAGHSSLPPAKTDHTSTSSFPELQSPNETVNEDIAARFLRLSNTSTEPSSTTVLDLKTEVKDQDVNKLLFDLRREQGTFERSSNNVTELERLLAEARQVVKEAEKVQPADSKGNGTGIPVGTEPPTGPVEVQANVDTTEHEALTEDEEAAQYLQQILDEVALEGSEEEGEVDEEEPQQKREVEDEAEEDAAPPPAFSLPSAPSALPQSPSPETEDPSFDLPSAPSFTPSSRPVKIKPPPSLPKYTDEEMESWCVICNDDATFKCLGCEGELYCEGCWKEGHRGEGAGLEEKRHKWVTYRKKK